MSAPTVTRTETGARYAFAKAGDVLPMHTHTAETAHDILCEAGVCEVYSPQGFPTSWTRILDSAVTDPAHPHYRYRRLKPGPHEIRALTDMTTTHHAPLKPESVT